MAGRTSQASLGSPMSMHSSTTTQTMGSNTSNAIEYQRQQALAKELMQLMPPGSSLKQIATAAAKAQLSAA